MNLTTHPLVVRAKIRAYIQDSCESAIQFDGNNVKVFVCQPTENIPHFLNGFTITVIVIKKAM